MLTLFVVAGYVAASIGFVGVLAFLASQIDPKFGEFMNESLVKVSLLLTQINFPANTRACICKNRHFIHTHSARLFLVGTATSATACHFGSDLHFPATSVLSGQSAVPTHGAVASQDSTSYTGYEEDPAQGRGSPQGFLGLGNLYPDAGPGAKVVAAKVSHPPC